MSMTVVILIRAVNLFFRLLEILIIIRVFLSWIPLGYGNPFKKIIYSLTEPILGPIRKLMDKSIFGGRQMMIDFSPMIAFLLIQILQVVIIRLLLLVV